MIKSGVYCQTDKYLSLLVDNRFVGTHLTQWKKCKYHPAGGISHEHLIERNNWSFIGPPVTVRWEDDQEV